MRRRDEVVAHAEASAERAHDDPHSVLFPPLCVRAPTTTRSTAATTTSNTDRGDSARPERDLIEPARDLVEPAHFPCSHEFQGN